MNKLIKLLLVVYFTTISSMLSAAEICHTASVVDGDTVLLECENYNGMIGLVGIDAPELSQPYGEEAAEYLKELLGEKELILKSHDRATKKGKLLFQGGGAIIPRLVKSGLAWSSNRQKTQSNYLLKLEKKAKKAGKGLWANASYEPPWAYRKRLKLTNDEDSSLDSLMARRGGVGTGNSMERCLQIKDEVEQLICKDKVYNNFKNEAEKEFKGACAGMSGDTLRECLYGVLRKSKKIAEKYK